MNGRIYDPLLGRFLSADKKVPNPGNLQGYNRYSYVYNNPLKYWDPEGYSPEATAVMNNQDPAGGGIIFETDKQEQEAWAGSEAGMRQFVRGSIAILGEFLQGDLTGPAPGVFDNIAAETDAQMESRGIDTSSEYYQKSKGGTQLIAELTSLLVSVRAGRTGSESKLGKGDVKPSPNPTNVDVEAPAPKSELHRPYIRKPVRAEVDANAPRTPDGRPIDPNTGKPIDGKPDLGHKTGNEFKREKAKAEAEGLSQEEFNDRMNDSDLYQLEDPSSNRSHRYEKKD